MDTSTTDRELKDVAFFVETGIPQGVVTARAKDDVLGVFVHGSLLFKVTPKDIRGNKKTIERFAPMLVMLAKREGLEFAPTDLRLNRMRDSTYVRMWRWKKPEMVDDTSLLQKANLRTGNDVYTREPIMVHHEWGPTGESVDPRVLFDANFTPNFTGTGETNG